MNFRQPNNGGGIFIKRAFDPIADPSFLIIKPWQYARNFYCCSCLQMSPTAIRHIYDITGPNMYEVANEQLVECWFSFRWNYAFYAKPNLPHTYF